MVVAYRCLKSRLSSILKSCAALAAAAAGWSAAAAYNSAPDPLAYRLLAAHNGERVRLGLSPLQWDPVLASSAASYGPALAAGGRLTHSPRENRPGQRENLWRGTRGSFTPEQMVGSWLDERRVFRPGIFPAVSLTGNWLDVSHYTTIIWPTTTRVGCAIHSDHYWDYLICRYTPPGNIDGRQVP